MILVHFLKDVLETLGVGDVDAPSVDFDVLPALRIQGFEDSGFIFLKPSRRAR